VTGATLHILEYDSELVDLVAFLPDGKVVLPLYVSYDWIAEERINILWLGFLLNIGQLVKLSGIKALY
jgi:hypothetical protein